MTDAVFHLLASFGVIYVVTESAIFAPARIYLALKSVWIEVGIYCASCTGFWAGLIVYLAQAVEAGRWSGWTLLSAAFAGLIVVGAVQVLRVFGDFLPGAHDREREIIKQWRQHQSDADA